MANRLQCAAKMKKPACLPQLSAPQPLSQVMLIPLAFGRHFPPFCFILQCNTLQAQRSFYQSNGWDCIWGFFFWFPFSLWTWLLLFIWRTCWAVSLGTWRSSVSKMGSGQCIPCLWSEPLTDVISSINLLTFARPSQWESMKIKYKSNIKKRKKILKRNCPWDIIGKKKPKYIIYRLFCILVLRN